MRDWSNEITVRKTLPATPEVARATLSDPEKFARVHGSHGAGPAPASMAIGIGPAGPGRDILRT